MMATDKQVEAAIVAWDAEFRKVNPNLGRWPDDYADVDVVVMRTGMRNILEAAEAAAWQPIETAPRDGTRVLVYQDGEAAVASWMTAIEDGSGDWIIWRRNGSNPLAIRQPAPTLWQPIRMPPAQGGE